MRLLNVKRLLERPKGSLESEELADITKWFETEDAPEYAILSHRWYQHEVSFRDIKARERSRAQRTSISRKPTPGTQENDKQDSIGYWRFQGLLNDPQLKPSAEKIHSFCVAADKQGYEWAWDDTCCIDKDSPSELAEAIASMYNWYSRAGKCLAVLTDVELSPDGSKFEASFRNSDWFKRGWTLQELLAPSAIEFYDREWKLIGSRQELAPLIEAASGIQAQNLGNFARRSQSISIATKMSWAAQRSTKKPEDRVYSLFGLFGVRIDIRYGEGLSEAFFRLQEAIITRSRDETIFAWRSSDPEVINSYGLLAPSIDCFADSASVHERPDKYRSRGAYTMTNGVLHFPVPIKFVGGARATNDMYYAIKSFRNKLGRVVNIPIECWIGEGKEEKAIFLHMQQQPNGDWLRVECDKFELEKKITRDIAIDINHRGMTREVHIPQRR